MDKLTSQRIRRKLTNNADSKKYEKTKNGFIMRMYRNMKSRVTGVTKKKNHLYLGKDILDKELFYEIAKSSKEFDILFENWKNNNYNRKLTPSIDRKDSKFGYTKENIRFITHSENSRLGSNNKIYQ